MGLKQLLATPVASVVLFAMAAGLIGFGTVRGIQAAPRIESDQIYADVELPEIATGLVENGTLVPNDGKLLGSLVPKDETFKIGKKYDETLAVQNTGSIDEYVRVTVSTYWTKDGETLRATDLSPEYIQPSYVTGDGWTIDSAASTRERTVLYYADILEPGDISKPFVDAITIDGEVITVIGKDADGADIYRYKGYEFHLKAKVDAVQTHNADEARLGAWGQISASE